VVAGYEVLENLGKGPTGVALYRARQVLVNNRQVLLKVVFAGEDPGQIAWGSLRGEAAALGKAQHPNILQILEAGERERHIFYNAVEFVDGPTLAEVLRGKPLPPRQAALLVETLARAVHHAHEKGVVHRSLKPACVRLQPVVRRDPGRDPGVPASPPCCELHEGLFLPRIGDWGLARRPVEGEVTDAELQGEQPYYLSPEQAWGRAREIDSGCDIYALGAMLYELLAGRPPFRESSPAATLDAIQCREAPPPSRFRGHASPDLEAICRRCLAKQPRKRYSSALALAADLRRWLNGTPIWARPISWPAQASRWLVRHLAGLGLLVVGAAVSWGVLALTDNRPHGRMTPTSRAGQAQKDLTRGRPGVPDLSERSAYYQRIRLAERALEGNDPQSATDLLDACPADFRPWEWHYLHCKAEGRPDTVLGRPRPDLTVRTLAFSPNGTRLAAHAAAPDTRREGGPGAVTLWGLDLGNAELPLQLPRGLVTAIAFRMDSSVLTVLEARADGGRKLSEVVTFDATNGRYLRSQEIDFDTMVAGAYSQDNSRLLVANENGKLELRMAANLGPVMSLAQVRGGPGRHGRVATLNATGSRFAAVNPDGMQVWLQSGQHALQELVGHTDVVLDLAVHPEMGLVATASRDGTARLWKAGAPAQVLQGHQGSVTSVALSPDASRVATSGSDGTVRIWDPTTGLEVLTLKDFAGKPTAVAFSPTDLRLAVAHGDRVTLCGGVAQER
jgi:hypothetical protein